MNDGLLLPFCSIITVQCQLEFPQFFLGNTSGNSHLCQHVRAHAPFSMHVGCACHVREYVSQWIINGCNVMTDDSERTVPPHPWPGCVVLVSTVRRRRRPTQSDWLILSSTLLLSLHSVRSELSCNLSQSPSAWLQKSQKISIIPDREPAHCPPLSSICLMSIFNQTGVIVMSLVVLNNL